MKKHFLNHLQPHMATSCKKFPSLKVSLKFSAHIRSSYSRYWNKTSLVKIKHCSICIAKKKFNFQNWIKKNLSQGKSNMREYNLKIYILFYYPTTTFFHLPSCHIKQWPLNNQNKVSHYSEDIVLRLTGTLS